MKVTYKYKIGQKVKLLSDNTIDCSHFSEDAKKQIIGKEVTIVNRGFEYGDDKYGGELIKDKIRKRIFYYIAEDPYIESGNVSMFNECAFEGEVFNEVVNEHPKMGDGIEVKLGDIVYDHVIDVYDGKMVPNCSFSFAGEGPLVQIRKNYRYWDASFDPRKMDDFYIFTLCRTFLCKYLIDGKIVVAGDARRPGERTDFYAYTGIAKIPDNYAELFIETMFDGDAFHHIDGLYDRHYSWDVEQWLMHFGVWEQVKKAYEERTGDTVEEREIEKQKEQRELDNLKEIINTLTPEQIKKLKTLL